MRFVQDKNSLFCSIVLDKTKYGRYNACVIFGDAESNEKEKSHG